MNKDILDGGNFHFAQSATDRATFIKKTYTHLAGAIAAFFVLEYILLTTGVFNNFWLSMMGSSLNWLLILGFVMVGSWIARSYAFKIDKQQQYIGLGLYVVIEALLFNYLLLLVMMIRPEAFTSIITQAGGMTVALFTGLTAVVIYTKKDFSFLRSALVVGGFVALGLIVVGALTGFDLGLWFSFFMILLASGAILFETSKIFRTYPTEFYVGASLGLFASFMMLLWYLIQIFASRD